MLKDDKACFALSYLWSSIYFYVALHLIDIAQGQNVDDAKNNLVCSEYAVNFGISVAAFAGYPVCSCT